MISKLIRSPILYILALLVAIAIVGYLGMSKIETLSTKVATQEIALATLSKENKKLNDKFTSVSWYYRTVGVNQAALDKRLNKLDDTVARATVIAAKPGLVTRIAKKQNVELEERLACASGNIQFCR